MIEPAHKSLQADEDDATQEANQDGNVDDDATGEISLTDKSTGDADPSAESTVPVIEAESLTVSLSGQFNEYSHLYTRLPTYRTTNDSKISKKVR